MTRIYLGSTDGADVVVIPREVLDEAGAKLDRQRAAEARAVAAKAADIERAKNTKRAMAARRFKRALAVFARRRP
jgi:hypothetical protein